MLIKARNLLADESLKTYLTNPEVAGTNVIRWKNPDTFSASWAVQIGKTGANQSEVVLLSTSTPAGTAGTLTANTLYEHPADTPLYPIKYDQVVFEHSATGTTGTATPVTNGTITIQPNSLYTIFDDTAATTAYAFKTYFRNSALNITSTESDWLLGTTSGFSFYALGKLRQRVKDRLYDATYIPNDLMIDDWINEWIEQMNNAMLDVNKDYGLGTTQVAFLGTVDMGTITNTDYRGQVKRVWYTDGSGTFAAQQMDSASFSPTKVFTVSYPYYFLAGTPDNIIYRRPNDTNGTFLIEYPTFPNILVNDTDTLPIPMQSYTQSFVDYAEGMARKKDNKFDIAAALIQKAEQKMEQFKTQLAPRLYGNEFIQVVEDTGAEQDAWIT